MDQTNEPKLLNQIFSSNSKAKRPEWPGSSIKGVGLYAPQRIVPNSFFNELSGKDVDSFLREQRNIYERRWMEEDQATSDLALPAAIDALKMAGITSLDLDLIVVATDTPDYLSPSTASVLQSKLGARKSAAFDLNSACAGFVTALDLANKYICSDPHYQNILVIGAYAMSKFLNFEDYKIASLFADGAGAVVLRASSTSKILAAELYADSQYYDHMGIYAGGSARPITHEVIESRTHLLNFAKKIPLETNPTQWRRLSYSILDRLHKSPWDIAHFFMTQINIQSIHQTLDSLEVPRSRAHNIMDRFGYTGSASVPMALADAHLAKKIKTGELCLLLGSGGGLSMAALALEWDIDEQ